MNFHVVKLLGYWFNCQFPPYWINFWTGQIEINNRENLQSTCTRIFFNMTSLTADGTPTFTTTPKPAQIMYGAKLKFVELGDNYILPTRGSREYNKLQERVAKALEATDLSLVPGFEEVVVNKFRG